MHKRGSNPHIGEMVQFNLPWGVFRALGQIKRRSDRCTIDVLRLALQHYVYRRDLYEDLTFDRKRARHRVDVRVSLALRQRLDELSWDDDMIRGHWIPAVLSRFIERTDRAGVIRVLKRGEDLIHQIMESSHGEAGTDRPWYATLRRADEGANRRSRHGRGSAGDGVDDQLPGWLPRPRLREGVVARG